MVLVSGHVDKYIDRLKEHVGQRVDLVRWYNYATFDIIGKTRQALHNGRCTDRAMPGDLAFGSDFGCLASSDCHPWISTIMGSIKAMSMFSVIARYIEPRLVLWLVPRKARRKKEDHDAMTTNKVKQRLDTITDRADFLSYVLKHNDEKGMSEPELIANSGLLILAGSETSASALSGTTYLLFKDKEALSRATAEIRTTFPQEEDMTVAALAQCEYLNHVLKEGMRLYPPAPNHSPRKVLTDDLVVSGHAIPKGVSALYRVAGASTDDGCR